METHLLLLSAVMLPFATAPWLAVAGRRWKTKTGWWALALPVTCTILIATASLRLAEDGATVHAWRWIPSLGIDFALLADGLSIFFALLVSGMGCIVVFYATHYLDHHYRHHGRFYCYLILFMGSMLGTVLSDNLMLLFVFWELTSITSFLLIGFLHGDEEARIGARQAMLITVATGLLMMTGIILLGTEAGTYSLTEMLRAGLPENGDSNLQNAALILIMIGAFGKSAQVPLQFWLPNAMTAPTPVSAYLHSATMVKLGIFIAARVHPLAAEAQWWMPLLVVFGFSTMLFGSVVAFLSHELKAILAFATVSQLGFLMGYYGLTTTGAVAHDYLHILNHACYKACLFMAAGFVMHATGVKDIRKLGGLFSAMPAVAVASFIALAAMAGIPGTLGFISKEAFLKQAFDSTSILGMPGKYAATLFVLASIVQVAFSFRLFTNVFLGSRPSDLTLHLPRFAMAIPVLFLASLLVVLGIAPGGLGGALATFNVAGLHGEAAKLSLWHGWNRELAASAGILAFGAALYFVAQRNRWRWRLVPAVFRFDRAFERGLEFFGRLTAGVTRGLRADQPLDFLPIVIGCLLLCLLGGIVVPAAAREQLIDVVRQVSSDHFALGRTFVAALIIMSILSVVCLRLWTTQLISLSIAGFLICFYFVLYRAPDLALTQILIEVVSLFMVLLLLGRFRRSADRGERTGKHTRGRTALNIVLAAGVGMGMTAATLLVTSAPAPAKLGTFFLANTVPLAEGTNAVNTILVDFRGFDTLGEITVLVIAMLGCLGLLMRRKRSPEEYRAGPLGPPGFGTEPEDHK